MIMKIEKIEYFFFSKKNPLFLLEDRIMAIISLGKKGG